MIEGTRKLLCKLEGRIKEIQQSIHDPIKNAEACVLLCLEIHTKLKNEIINGRFISDAEEIEFFRYWKPQLVSKLIFYARVNKIELRKPNGSCKERKKYLLTELAKLKLFFDDNQDFYRYYRGGFTYLDHKYFLRGKQDIQITIDSYFFDTDPQYSTSHDFKVAEILANDLLQTYLEQELHTVDNPQALSHSAPSYKLTWTEHKTALTELLYAFHTHGVFENGKADLNQIASYFETVFNVDLGDYYRTFIELRLRKTGRTKFIDVLRNSLHKRMDDAEDRG